MPAQCICSAITQHMRPISLSICSTVLAYWIGAAMEALSVSELAMRLLFQSSRSRFPLAFLLTASRSAHTTCAPAASLDPLECFSSGPEPLFFLFRPTPVCRIAVALD